MTATAEPPAPAGPAPGGADVGVGVAPLERAPGVELLGPVHGSGYRDGVSLVRRADGQIVQLGPLMYGLLECADGQLDGTGLADELSARLGRRLDAEQVVRLAEKLAAQGLLAGTEQHAPPRRNPLLALRWRVLVTDPRLTNRLTAPFTVFFRPWIMWPALLGFAAIFWFVLIEKGLASATSQAFRSPGLLLLVFALAVVSAGFHELGHAAACRYSGATPGGMGMGLYLVWPAFYTDVTDAYRLPRRDRLRIDLAGLYFNAVVADVTMLVWVFWRVDALLLLVAIQILQMVKQLSPIIRADGYHILADATGVPDLYAHMGPTMRRLLPGHRREPSALTGRARLLVTLWVLVIVPVLLSLMLGAVLLLPRLAASAWDSGRLVAHLMPHQAHHLQLVGLGASLLRLVALVLPVLGSLLVTQKIVRTSVSRARAWSAGRPGRRAAVTALAAGTVAVLAWAWWPSGQYQPVRPGDRGTLPGLVQLISAPQQAARPVATPSAISPGAHLVAAMIPVGGPTPSHPAIFIIPGTGGRPPVELVSSGPASPARPGDATGFPFVLPGPPGPGGTQALAVGTTDGRVTYDVAYAVVTVSGGAPVTETNAAYALASCHSCTTVAVSFQVVLVVGQSNDVAPIDAAGALNWKCPACTTAALADQLVVTLTAQPSPALVAQLQSALAQLGYLHLLGAAGTPQAVAAQVAVVQQQVEAVLRSSGLLAGPATTNTTTATGGSTSTTVTTTVSVPPTTLATVSPTTVSGASPTTTAPSSTSTTAPTGSPTTVGPSSSTTAASASTTVAPATSP